MSFQTELKKTKEKGANTPHNNNLTSILFGLTACIYFANAVYLNWFTKNPDMGEVTSTVALGAVFLCIGVTFYKNKN
jgi:hypothetical protein